MMAERSVSHGKESMPVSTGLPHFLGVAKLSLDRSPMKPTRRSWAKSDRENATECRLLASDEDDSSDICSTCSDLTDPSAFGMLRSDSLDCSFSTIDSSWRQDSYDVSMRVDALGRLDEDKDYHDSLDSFVWDDIISPSLQDPRAAFAAGDKNDLPPQLAMRMHSTSDMSLDLESIDDDSDVQGVVPDDQDKLVSPPKPAHSHKESLAKLAGAFKAGCTVGTHTYHLKKYPNTFIGSEAVDFMLSVNLASTREDAVFLGRKFCKDLNLFHHVCWDHSFKDGLFFYKFNDDLAKDTANFTPINRKELVLLSEKFAKGMPVSRHMSSRFKSYSNTFSGEEAVDYMVKADMASNRPAAVFLGQRMMEELDIFEPAGHNRRFKDSSYRLYRFVSREESDTSYDECSSTQSLMEIIGAQQHQYVSLSPLPAVKNTQASALASAASKRKNLRVSFGLVQSRCFERRLEFNPATSSGPSLGLGWRFYDDSPVPLNDGDSEASKRRSGRLSVEDRTSILKEWGYSKGDIKRVSRAIKIAREQRKRSLNNDMRRS